MSLGHEGVSPYMCSVGTGWPRVRHCAGSNLAILPHGSCIAAGVTVTGGGPHRTTRPRMVWPTRKRCMVVCCFYYSTILYTLARLSVLLVPFVVSALAPLSLSPPAAPLALALAFVLALALAFAALLALGIIAEGETAACRVLTQVRQSSKRHLSVRFHTELH